LQLVTGRQGLFLIVVIIGSIQAAAGARSQSLQHCWLIPRSPPISLASDAEETETLILSDTNWITHALMLAKVKEHVDNMALIIEKLSKAQKSGSELQEQAVERMLPLVKELSANTTAAINYLNQNKDRPISDAYTEYLKKNTEAARQLSSMISSPLEYQESMAEIEKLRSKLVVSGSPTP
jgi:hypothetical protein